ncbi:MAG: O-antigen ligase family protein [Bacteroidia bacterium]
MKTTARLIFDYFPILLAFLMPFGGAHLPVVVILWVISSFFCVEEDYFIKGLKNKWFLLLLTFFFLHVLSGLFSHNFKEAVTGVEIKLSFLAFPLCLFLFRYKPLVFQKVITAFVSGCLFALLFCIGRAVFFYVKDGSNYFYYSSFSYFIHTACFSMYILFAWLALQLLYPVWFKGDVVIGWLRYGLSILFIIGIFLCASKIGIIAFFIIQLAVVLIKYKNRLSLKNGMLALALFVVLVVVAYKVAPTPFDRLRSAFNTTVNGNPDKTSGESTAVRMLIWNECAGIIKEHFLTGVGTGDANDVLIERYRQHGLTGALEHNLNAHNQFFQTFIALGVIGFVLLLYLTIGAMVAGFAKHNLVLALFAFIISLNFLVESMLQRQDGTLFYAYFLCLLLNYNPTGSEAEQKA